MVLTNVGPRTLARARYDYGSPYAHIADGNVYLAATRLMSM
jgi:hypothetical protein